ncbi:hypothetical protein J3R30DRAFT_3524603 [Lentinula aciculospora]|uniref:C3H1-type domain-containing protein n=1 Tax=Lentinula aciculospora TaxID=153920 RepID=A0A9W9A321_9AGAR|nr:hypothetical protein J3R30DRAFT_3524603 [Lentinula aciculospora]
MSTQSMSTVNQQMWDDALKSILNLSKATIKHNMELEARVSELERELLVWKCAHSVALEASERDNVHIASLNKQISKPDGIRDNGAPLVLCVINGQKTFFNQSLLTLGFIGGQNAAQYFTKAISDYLTSEMVQIFGRLSFWVSIYFNKSELVSMLVGQGICSREQLEGFLAGFSESSPRFTAVDVGIGEGAADRKIREYIQTYTRLPETLRIFLGGCYETDALYSGTFNHLQSERLLGKLVILHSLSEDLSDQAFAIPVLNVAKLLVQQPLQLSMQQLTPLSVTSSMEHTSGPSNGGLVSPQSPVNGIRYTDPRYPLHKQNPPPCNEHYLMACSKGPGTCRYSHDYILSTEQLSELAENAKKAPCNWLKSGLHCPYGESCCWGHICPHGTHCFHLRKGKCWFKGEGMHNA